MFYTILNEGKKTENMKNIQYIQSCLSEIYSCQVYLNLPVQGTSLYTIEDASPHTTHDHIIIETFPFDKS